MRYYIRRHSCGSTVTDFVETSLAKIRERWWEVLEREADPDSSSMAPRRGSRPMICVRRNRRFVEING